MPDNYFDKIIKKIGDDETVFLAKDALARQMINTINADIASMSDAVDYLWNVGESPVLYVSKDNSRFQTINAAIAYARTYLNTMHAHVTILIAPGLYEEYIDIDTNPGINLIGLYEVRIRSSVAWRLSTLRCSTAIRVANIIFENYYTPAAEEHAGYALHADPITGGQVYYNCSFYSDNNAAVGIGMGSMGQATFYNCTFRGSPGGIYAHNNASDGTQGQWLRFYNCIIEDHNNGNCIRIDDAATMANPSYTSKMGLVFVGCSGNNNGITYRFNNPMQTLSYIPANSTNYNVFLYQESSRNELIGLDPVKQTKTVILQWMSAGDDEWYIPVADAYKYAWTLSTIKYRDRGDSAWGSWTDFEGTKTLQVIANDPDAIRIHVPGTASLAAGKRVFYATLTGIPRKLYTFPNNVS